VIVLISFFTVPVSLLQAHKAWKLRPIMSLEIVTKLDLLIATLFASRNSRTGTAENPEHHVVVISWTRTSSNPLEELGAESSSKWKRRRFGEPARRVTLRHLPFHRVHFSSANGFGHQSATPCLRCLVRFWRLRNVVIS